jgi:hypothetical protein
VAARKKRYLDEFPPNIVAEVEKIMPLLERKLKAAGLVLTNTPKSSLSEHIGNREVEMIKFERCSAVVTYRVTIGRITTEVVVLNLARKASTQNRRILSKGTFG